MSERWARVRSLRERAAEVRKMAAQYKVPSSRDALLISARNYERMAEELERRLKEEGVKPLTE